MRSPRSHPEWNEALVAFVRELDIPDRQLLPVRSLIGPGLGRVFVKSWIEQDKIDPEIMRDPFDRSDDPRWYQIDGWPIRGGSKEEILRRKWERRAGLYVRWHGIEIWHVLDWLIYSQATNAPWTANVDERGEPKKLMKCGSLDALVHEADKGFRLRPRSGHLNGDDVKIPVAAGASSDDETEIADLGVDHTLVELLTPRALRAEGGRMRHCIGHGSYDDRVRDPEYRYLSVRDPNGVPLATLELKGRVVRQFRGPVNDDPLPAVTDLLSRYAAENGWQGYEDAAIGRYVGNVQRVLFDDLLAGGGLDGGDGGRHEVLRILEG